MTKELLTVKQVQDILQVSERTIFRMLGSKTINGFKVGREWRFDPADIDAFIERQKKAQEAK